MNKAPEGPVKRYIKDFIVLVRNDGGDPIREALRHRLSRPGTENGDKEAAPRLPSPPVGREEYSAADLLTLVYDKLEDEADSKTLLDRFRRALVMELGESLNEEPLDYLRTLGLLIGHCQIADSKMLAPMVRDMLWGHLSTRFFSEPFCMPDDPERVQVILDLWSATFDTSADETLTKLSQREQLCKALTDLTGRSTAFFDTATANLVITLFRALMKVAPFMAGNGAFSKICAMTARLESAASNGDARDSIEQFKERWLGLCWDYGVMLDREEDPMADLFAQALSRANLASNCREALGELGPLGCEALEKLPDPAPSDARKVPTGPRHTSQGAR